MQTMTTTTTIPIVIIVEKVEGRRGADDSIQIPIGIMLNEGILHIIHPKRRVIGQRLPLL